MTIKQRLQFLIAVMVVGLLGLTCMEIVLMRNVYTATNTTNVKTVPSLLAIDKSFDSVAQLRVQLWQYIALKDPMKRIQVASSIGALRKKLVEALEVYEQNYLSGEKDKELLEADRQVLADFESLRAGVMELASNEKDVEALALLLQKQEVMTQLANAFNTHRQYNVQLGQDSADAAAHRLDLANSLALGIALVLALGLVVLGLRLSSRLVRELNRAVQVAQSVPALSTRMPITPNMPRVWYVRPLVWPAKGLQWSPG
jgi:methyl-accepting chemotaxis protein